MDGEKLIDKICEILDKEDIRLYDSQIVRKLSALNKHQLDKLLKD